jgi:hypothetical protein
VGAIGQAAEAAIEKDSIEVVSDGLRGEDIFLVRSEKWRELGVEGGRSRHGGVPGVEFL